ncbi:MAG: hypothetical protein ACRC7O_06265 [Fimbriiglobus sp.]
MTTLQLVCAVVVAIVMIYAMVKHPMIFWCLYLMSVGGKDSE